MGLTSIDFGQIENVENTPTGVNINKAIRFNNELSISDVPPSQENTSNIWFNKSTEELKIRINNTTYDLLPSASLNSITVSSNTTINLGGKRGIVNNLTINGTNTVLTVRTGSLGWSILEVQGDLTIASGCTLNLIRNPLIVRGNIIGDGIITSPNGANGGVGGSGGPGGTGGSGGPNGNVPSNVGGVGQNAISIWPQKTGSLGSLVEIEYEISSAKGGDGVIGTPGGGGGGGITKNPTTTLAAAGGASGNGNPGGISASGSVNPPQGFTLSTSSGGGGGISGSGQNAIVAPINTVISRRTGGAGNFAGNGLTGQNIFPYYNENYIGIAIPSLGSPGLNGTFGGAGGLGAIFINNLTDLLATPGSPGGQGGAGGPGGSTGGAHLTVFCVGDISDNITFRPGKGGINGGVLNGPKATTGSIWLFNKYGTLSSPGSYDISGIGPAPTGPIGTVNRILTSNSSEVNTFFREILYNSNGIIPPKEVIAINI